MFVKLVVSVEWDHVCVMAEEEGSAVKVEIYSAFLPSTVIYMEWGGEVGAILIPPILGVRW